MNKPSTEVIHKQITLRVSKREYDLIKRASIRHDQTITDILRQGTMALTNAMLEIPRQEAPVKKLTPSSIINPNTNKTFLQ
jgi:uncharacterized protein (DUF1778 family)